MAQLDPRIILSGKVASDPPGSFQRGLRFAEEQRQFQENRKMAPLRKKAAQQAVEIGDLKISAAEREREFFEARRGLMIAQRADTPEKWDKAAEKLGLDELVGQFPRREEMIANFEMMIEALDPSTPDEPRFFKGQRGAVNQIIPDGQGGYGFKEIVPPGEASAGVGKPSLFAEKLAELEKFMPREEAVRLLTQKGGININLGGEPFSFSGDESGGPNPAPPDQQGDTDVDPGRALGLGGAARIFIGKAGDFLGLGQFFEESVQAADNLTFLKTRFLFATRNMINQRMSNQMLDLVNKLTVAPGSIIGREGAMIRLRNGFDLIEDNVAGLQRVADNREGKFSKKAVSDAAQDGILLTNLLGEYKAVINSLAAPEPEAAAPQPTEEESPPLPQSAVDDGITPTNWKFMTPEERAIWLN